MIATYYSLTKPGIIYGNAVTAAAGFFLGSQKSFDPLAFVAMLFGISLIIACGCVLNNYIDRDIDILMERTKKRALVAGTVSARAALIFATGLGILGTLVLGFGTNTLSLLVALGGLFFYVVVYSLWSKRHTMHATLIGAISGAVPPVVGYCAASNSLDSLALLLFLVLAAWQIPHALAIAMYRIDDYAAASVPVLPLTLGMHKAKMLMTTYVLIYVLCSIALYQESTMSLWVGASFALLGIAWIVLSFSGFYAKDDKAWGRSMFFYSLISLLALSLLIATDTILSLLK